MKTIVPKFLALVSTGLLAGAFMYGLFNLVPSFYEVPVSVHLQFRAELMRHNTVTMQAFIIASVFTPLWYAAVSPYSARVTIAAVLSSILALTSALITRFANLPINQQIKTWATGNTPDNWLSILHTWDQYNVYRSLAALASFVLFIAAILFERIQVQDHLTSINKLRSN